MNTDDMNDFILKDLAIEELTAKVAELEALVENLREDNAMLLAAHDAAAFVAAIPTDNQRGE